MIYKLIGVTLFVVAVFFYGRSVGVDVTTLKQLEQSVKVQDRINDLTIKLRKSDELLIIEQQREAIVKREEVIKYVTKYRDVIKNVPTYIECIDNSGLLDQQSPSLAPPVSLLIAPQLLPRYTSAETAESVAIERGRIITDTRDRLVRLQEWVRGL